MGLYDIIQNQIEIRAKAGGISPFDLLDLPPRFQKIMRLMLREIELSQDQLWEATADMKEKDRLSESELEEALDALTEQHWLLKLGQGDVVKYKVNLRRKGPSSLAAGVWDVLEKQVSAEKPPGKDK